MILVLINDTTIIGIIILWQFKFLVYWNSKNEISKNKKKQILVMALDETHWKNELRNNTR